MGSRNHWTTSFGALANDQLKDTLLVGEKRLHIKHTEWFKEGWSMCHRSHSTTWPPGSPIDGHGLLISIYERSTNTSQCQWPEGESRFYSFLYYKAESMYVRSDCSYCMDHRLLLSRNAVSEITVVLVRSWRVYAQREEQVESTKYAFVGTEVRAISWAWRHWLWAISAQVVSQAQCLD